MTTSTATTGAAQSPSHDWLDIDLRDPRLGAFLAWLLPGAGHFYQRRYGKGIVFFTCILGTWFFGMYLGDSRVVYASNREEDRRLPYLCQVGVGLPALPALVQWYRMLQSDPPQAPLFGGYMAPPRLRGQIVPKDSLPAEMLVMSDPIYGRPNLRRNGYDELHQWQEELHGYFELGTVYTMIAGLLNVLAIFDAFAGPLLILPGKKEDAPAGEKPA